MSYITNERVRHSENILRRTVPMPMRTVIIKVSYSLIITLVFI